MGSAANKRHAGPSMFVVAVVVVASTCISGGGNRKVPGASSGGHSADMYLPYRSSWLYRPRDEWGRLVGTVTALARS